MVATAKRQHGRASDDQMMTGGRRGRGGGGGEFGGGGLFSAPGTAHGNDAEHMDGGEPRPDPTHDAPLTPSAEWREGCEAGSKWERRAREWMCANPEAMQCFRRLALRAAGSGRKFGMKQLGEVVRWEMKIERNTPVRVGGSGGGEFKINNNYLAYIGRELIREFPHLAEFIEMRKAGSEEEELTTEAHPPTRAQRSDQKGGGDE